MSEILELPYVYPAAPQKLLTYHRHTHTHTNLYVIWIVSKDFHTNRNLLKKHLSFGRKGRSLEPKALRETLILCGIDRRTHKKETSVLQLPWPTEPQVPFDV